MRRAALISIVLALVGAACGGGESATSTSLPSVPSTSTSTSTPASSTSSATPQATTTTTALPPLQGVVLEPVADGFEQPVWAGVDPGTGELLVVERRGRILGIDGSARLDIDARVGSGGNEQGLLGLAFHPDDPDLWYVNYTDTGGDTVVSEFQRLGGTLDPGTERVLLEIDQPAGNHNGGNLAFGPDGLLYVGMGDGGGSDDRFGTGQDPFTRLGSMLRLDPRASNALAYTIPSDNPIGEEAGDPLTFAYGLRNPWRYSFDGDLLYVADVGQRRIEEVTVVDIGTVQPGQPPNFGWSVLEGTECFADAGCDRTGLLEPVAEYTHADGCSITGGVVMHDPAIPELDGFYIYGDFCTGFVRGFFYQDGVAVGEAELLTGVPSISSFGVDADGSVLVVSLTGTISRMAAVR